MNPNHRPTDGWLLYNAQDECIGQGTGYVQLQEGEYLVLSDAPFSEPDAIDSEERSSALYDILEVNSADRDSILEIKAVTAQAFLDDVTTPLPPDDPDVIDKSLYETLYDEYWTTYDLVDWTPTELAQAIVARNQEKKASGQFKSESMKEAERRRQKLIAEARLKS